MYSCECFFLLYTAYYLFGALTSIALSRDEWILFKCVTCAQSCEKFYETRYKIEAAVGNQNKHCVLDKNT